eukprot:c26332_g1_i1 orf=313-786(-)
MGKIYAACIMYGYFLRRLYERFHLDMRFNTLPSRAKYVGTGTEHLVPCSPSEDFQRAETKPVVTKRSHSYHWECSTVGDSLPSKLRSYFMSLDDEIIKRYSKMDSTESVEVIERQAQAFFGGPRCESKVVEMSLDGVAFGAMLWEAEIIVDDYYSLT